MADRVDEHPEWTGHFSSYVDGELDGPRTAELEEHLSSCGACRRALEEVRDVVARARGLEERRPRRDLWPGISAVIGAPVTAREEDVAEVIALPTAGGAPAARTPSIAFTPAQLAAAALFLIATSVVATWWAGPGVAARSARETPATDVFFAADDPDELPPLPAGLSDELGDLEERLVEARQRLDPNTVRVIERNLAVIEQAIADSRRALQLDPENEFLAHHLERVVERKLTYLRDAARVIDRAG